MQDIFETQIVYLKGVGPKKAEVLKKELNVVTFEDLLYCFPFRYIDKSRIYKVSEVTTDSTWFQLKGRISNLTPVGDKRVRYITAKFTDDTGSIGLVWFRGLTWIKKAFSHDKEYILFGKPSVFKNRFNFVHPELEEFVPGTAEVAGQRLEGVYSSNETLKNHGLGSRGISKLMRRLLIRTAENIRETLPAELVKRYKLLDRKSALLNIHFPESPSLIEKATRRLKFEELLFLQLQILRQKIELQEKIPGLIFTKVGNYLNDFYANHLPFQLTNAQKRVIKEIRADLKSGKQMNRLLQGDVGSGKTLVALMSMLIALDNGYQCCLMAPTEILANQHFNSISALLGKTDIRLALLTGSTKQSRRKIIHAGLEEGSLQILIGTHALIEDTVRFHKLGFVVIDEQHRFGVAQRAKLWKKNKVPPHVLVMTATPIPRTLAMTLYGNLDVSVIDEMPPGRKPVKTVHYFESKRLRLIGFMREQIRQGRQIYVVYPLIS